MSFTSTESFRPRTSHVWARLSPSRGHWRCGHRTRVDLTPAEPPPRPQLPRGPASRHTFTLHHSTGVGFLYGKMVQNTQIKKRESGGALTHPMFTRTCCAPCADAGRPEITQTILALQTSRHPVSPQEAASRHTSVTSDRRDELPETVTHTSTLTAKMDVIRLLLCRKSSLVLTIKPRIAGVGHSSLWPRDPESEERLPFTDPSAESILPPCGPPLAGSAVYEPQHPALEFTTRSDASVTSFSR